MNLLQQIEKVKFRCVKPKQRSTDSGWHQYEPRQIETSKLAIKARYHMKQLLACLWELKRRDIPVCEHLSKNITEYKSCYIKYNDQNGELTLLTTMRGR